LNTTFIFASVTYAIKARKLLERNGIKSKLVKTLSNEKRQGCAYGLKFNSSEFYDTAKILRENNITYTVLPKKTE
jgi:hypothetical protein